MALIPEDRKTEGLMLPMSVRDNLSFAALGTLVALGRRRRGGRARGGGPDRAAAGGAHRRHPTCRPARCPGGNQQKLVIGKWLMMAPRILLLNDPTRGIDVGTKQEMYQLLRELADGGAAILFYSTDYDELVGCCDRVLVMYDGAIRRELVGAEITEHALVSSALNLGADTRGDAAPRAPTRMNGDWPYRLREHRGTLLAFAAFVAMFAIYAANHPAGLNANVATTAANKGVLLAIVAMAQTLVVLTSGHRPVGRHGDGARQLPGLAHRRRLAVVDGARRAGRAGSSALLCGAINGADRDLRTPAAHRHDDRHRRDLLRRRARAAPGARRRRRRVARRRADRPVARRHAGEPRCCCSRWCCSSGCRFAAR